MPLKVYFELPEQIALGLASGRLERVGGIIRDASSKQIVAWLRESGQLAFSDPNVTAGLLQALQSGSGGLASVATGVLDAALTARSHHLLKRQMQMLQRLQRFTILTGALNLALGAVSFDTILQSINQLAGLISAQAERDRENERESVIEYLDLIKHLSEDRKALASELAVMPLVKSRRNLLYNFNELLDKRKMTLGQTQSAIQYLVMTMQLDVLHVRNYLDTEEVTIAKRRLRDCVKEYRTHVQVFVKKLLGEFPAMYFHKTVERDDFHRYLQIEAWLRDSDDVLLEVVEEHRNNFWNNRASRALESSPLDVLRKDKAIDYLTALTMAELLIENLQRLEGFEIELATLRMSIAEWDRLANLEDNNFAVVVDLEILDDLSRINYLSAS